MYVRREKENRDEEEAGSCIKKESHEGERRYEDESSLVLQ